METYRRSRDRGACELALVDVGATSRLDDCLFVRFLFLLVLFWRQTLQLSVDFTVDVIVGVTGGNVQR